MNWRFTSGMLLFAVTVAPLCAQSAAQVIYTGALDGSAAVPVDSTCFAAASDEENILRIYSREGGGAPQQQVDMSSFLGVNPDSPETDIEGAALIGNRAFWITSHGRDKHGVAQPSRRRIFATDILTNASGIRLSAVGKPYTNLLADLSSASVLNAVDFARAAQRLPEEPGGLNIEGLAATPDGHLLIGFRNPIPNGRALIVPLLNPEELITGQRAAFGEPVLLDLGGLGIRDMAMWQGEYLIIAGHHDAHGTSKLFRWSGGNAKPHLVPQVSFKGLVPEAAIIYPDKGLREFQVLSDDSSKQKIFPPAPKGPERTRFRAVWVAP